MSRQTYGAPGIHAELAEQGIRVGRKRVERLMKAAGLRGVSRRKSIRTTTPHKRVRPASDRVDRNFIADQPNRLWVADITYVPTGAEARMAVFEFIEGWYNPGRRHSALAYRSPVNFEIQAQNRLSNESP